MSALDDLRAARALIADPNRWSQGATAQDAAGGRTDANYANAARWDALGALIRATPTVHLPGLRFLAEAGRSVHDRTLAEVNDGFGHAAVLSVYDRAIAQAEVQS